MATAMSLAMAAATDASLLHPAFSAHHKLAPASASLPLLFSRAPLLRSTRPRLPRTPFVASDAAEASLDWAETDEADETVPEEEPAVAEEEPVVAASGDYAAEPPEEAKIYVGNLPYDVDSERLAQLFDQAGVVEVAEVIYNRESGQSRGFGFVTMSTIEETDKAIETFNRYLPDEAVLSEVLESPGVQDWFNRAANVGDPDALFLALKFQERTKVQREIFGKLLPYPFSPDNFFAEEHLLSVAACFNESAFCLPRIHSIWHVITDMLIREEASQNDNNASSGKKHKKSKKVISSSDDSKKNLRKVIAALIS